MVNPTTQAIRSAWAALGGDPAAAAAVETVGPAGTLPARLPVTDLAVACVAAAGLAGLELARARGVATDGPLTVDSRAVAVSFTSDRHLRVGGRAFNGFAPLSRFWPTADGWVRTHANYPHHRRRLLAALDLDPARPDDDALVAAVGERLGARPAAEVEQRVTAAGGLAVAARTPDEWEAHPQAAAVAAEPLVRLRADAPAPARPAPPAPPGLPATGVRVLDLTRVIAGPVATRFLALLGADVLRVDSPGLPELEPQHLDTDAGKRSTLLDLGRDADRARFAALLADADVVVTGYRPGALDRWGLSPEALRRHHPTWWWRGCPPGAAVRGPAGAASTAWCRPPRASPTSSGGRTAHRVCCPPRRSTTAPAISSRRRCCGRWPGAPSTGARGRPSCRWRVPPGGCGGSCRPGRSRTPRRRTPTPGAPSATRPRAASGTRCRRSPCPTAGGTGRARRRGGAATRRPGRPAERGAAAGRDRLAAHRRTEPAQGASTSLRSSASRVAASTPPGQPRSSAPPLAMTTTAGGSRTA